MTELSRSTIVEYVAPVTLRAHPKNAEIYGVDEDVSDLVESIRSQGIIESLYVTADGRIISGHRRWRAAMQAGIPVIPVLRVTYADELDEREAIISHNVQRKKNGVQFYNEDKELRGIAEERARLREVAGGQLRAASAERNEAGNSFVSQGGENFPHPVKRGPRSRDIIAEQIGIGSGRQLEHLRKLGQQAEAGDELAAKLLPKIGVSMSINAATKQVKQSHQQEEQVARIAATPLPTGTYNVIVIDPPWKYGRADDVTHQSRNPYPSMTIEELEQFPIPAAGEAILWLWTTNAFLEEAFGLMRGWGFQYKTMLTWVKPNVGMGDWLRGQTEHCLLGVKGTYRIVPGNATTALHAPSGAHSEKPDEFYAMVDRLCVGTRIDIFARKERDGWNVWGADV